MNAGRRWPDQVSWKFDGLWKKCASLESAFLCWRCAASHLKIAQFTKGHKTEMECGKIPLNITLSTATHNKIRWKTNGLNHDRIDIRQSCHAHHAEAYAWSWWLNSRQRLCLCNELGGDRIGRKKIRNAHTCNYYWRLCEYATRTLHLAALLLIKLNSKSSWFMRVHPRVHPRSDGFSTLPIIISCGPLNLVAWRFFVHCACI